MSRHFLRWHCNSCFTEIQNTVFPLSEAHSHLKESYYVSLAWPDYDQTRLKKWHFPFSCLSLFFPAKSFLQTQMLLQTKWLQDNQTTFSSSYPSLWDDYGVFNSLVIFSVSSVHEGEFLMGWWFHVLLLQNWWSGNEPVPSETSLLWNFEYLFHHHKTNSHCPYCLLVVWVPLCKRYDASVLEAVIINLQPGLEHGGSLAAFVLLWPFVTWLKDLLVFVLFPV